LPAEQPAELSNKEEIYTMQKKLIAAAVAGLLAVPALAQTNVTISGRFAAGWESYKLQDCNTGFSCRNESRVSDQSSRLIFNVVEDLGGGLKAWGQLDYRGAVDLGGLGNTGNSGVGLMSNWGKFTIGRWDVHYGEIDGAIGGNRAGSLQTLLGNGIMSQVITPAVAGTPWGTIANGTRTPNLLMWDSPNWNGFTARLGYSTSFQAGEGSGRSATGTGNPGSGSAWVGTVRYNNGPWTAGYSHWSANTESGVTGAAMADQRSDRLWGGYTFAMGLKVGLAWDRSSIDAGLRDVASVKFKRSAWMIPVSYTFGPHKVYGQYAKASDASNTTGVDTGASAWNFGYDYAFSKRTSAGIYYTKLNNKSGAAYDMFALGANGATATSLVGGEDARQIYIGMAHNF
jgi:predicted porin